MPLLGIRNRRGPITSPIPTATLPDSSFDSLLADIPDGPLFDFSKPSQSKRQCCRRQLVFLICFLRPLQFLRQIRIISGIQTSQCDVVDNDFCRAVDIVDSRFEYLQIGRDVEGRGGSWLIPDL